nr:PREDICTED: uncharacterized protein LOC109035268 [Bemisia tabaci]
MLVVSVLVACSSVFVSWTTAEGAEPPDDPRNATPARLDPRMDLKPAAASGYIFRHDANSKPTLIRFGDHNLDQLEEFLKKTGFASSLPGSHRKPPESPIDDSGGHYPSDPPASPEAPHYVPFDPSSLDEDSVDPHVPLNFNFSGANYDVNEVNYDDVNNSDVNENDVNEDDVGEDPDYDYQEETTESGPEAGNSTSGADYPEYSEATPPTDEQESNLEDKPEGFDEPAEAQNNSPAKRLTSPTVKAFIAPIFDLGGKGRAGPLLEPLKYSTIGHHKNEPFHSPLVDDTYDDHDTYRHHPRKYSKGGGSSYDSGFHSSHGDKGSKGYDSAHDFHDGEYGHHGKEGKKGYYNDKAGHKNGYHDGGSHYGTHHAGEHGKKGAAWGETGHHKKGHKTTGYHNTYHKDEYKKEHKFYDDAHKEGYHDKHGSHHADHGKHSGGKKHGGYHDSAYNEGHKGKSGFYDKGHFDNEHAGHKGASGFDSNFGNFDEFGKKSGFNEHNKFGFSDF